MHNVLIFAKHLLIIHFMVESDKLDTVVDRAQVIHTHKHKPLINNKAMAVV